MTIPYIFSHFQAQILLGAINSEKPTITVSPDLGFSECQVVLEGKTAVFPDAQTLTVSQLKLMLDNKLSCFQLVDGEIEKVQFYSDILNRFYSLMPTESAPTMLISGTPMHRIKDTNPHKDTQMKVKAVTPINGRVLDTTMGLGYTASMAAESADHVTTIELDPTVVEVCRANPWSQQLFNNPKIDCLIGDAFDVVETLPDQEFSRVIHDPPMFKLAGHLYSTDFYKVLIRVMKPKARLFHYIGDPKSKSGRSVTKGVVKRLKEAGFRRVKPWPQAFGVIGFS